MILTGKADAALEALRLGAFGYVAKPFDFAELAQTVAAAVARRRRADG